MIKAGHDRFSLLLAGAAVSLALAWFTPNPLLTLASLGALTAVVVLLWRPAEPPILLFCAVYQWLQGSILLLYSNFADIRYDQFDLSGIALRASSWDMSLVMPTLLTLAGVVALAWGMRQGAGRPLSERAIAGYAEMALQLSHKKLLMACLATTLLGGVLSAVARVVPALTQPLLAAFAVHWVLVFVYTYVVLTRRRGYGGLALLLAFEVAIGLMSFFSEFKTVLIVMLMAALARRRLLRGSHLVVAAGVVVLALSLGVIWSAIKVEYRGFLNQGSKDQSVMVSRVERIAEVTRLVTEMTPEKFAVGAELLMYRLTYVYFFGEVIDTVPQYIPYERGALWGDAVYRALVPRLVDPTKSSIDDSERTATYTGLTLIGADAGTSISLGYMAESYIDFGPALMMLPIFLWGYAVGRVYRLLVTGPSAAFLGYGSATTLVLLNAAVLELSNAKMVAALVLTSVVLYLSQRYLSAPLYRLLRLHAVGPSPVERRA